MLHIIRYKKSIVSSRSKALWC